MKAAHLAVPMLACIAATGIQGDRSSEPVAFDDQNWGADKGDYSYALTRPSRDEVRFEVRNNDRRPADEGARERAEMRMRRELPHGTRVTACFAIRIDKVSTGHTFQIVSQWHTKVAKGWSPWLGFSYREPGKLLVSWSSSPAKGNPADIKATVRGRQVIPCAVGEWCRIRFTLLTGPANGRLVVEKNSRRYVDYRGPIGYFTTPQGAARMGYMKIGIYRWHADQGTDTVVRFRNVQVSADKPA